MSSDLRYCKFLLNRVTASKLATEYLENVLVRDDESAKFCFHKIIVHNWTEDEEGLYRIICEYFNTSFVPIDYVSKNDTCSFYTSSLSLVMKILKLDFMFPYRRNMFNMDILFNDKTSIDIFRKRATLDDMISSVVSNRFNEKMELNLSNFCNDQEFIKTKINFYQLSLLANFKILMLRIGRDTKLLNLSNNNLTKVPIDILNFFIKGDIIGLNLSDNNIVSIEEHFGISSKLEKLWLEGNPLCEEMDFGSYIKEIVIKFPRLTELDGIKINQHGVMFPMTKQFSVTSDRKTKLVVEKFLTLYFSHYDKSPRTKIEMFYATDAVLTMTLNSSNYQVQKMAHYASVSRNAYNSSEQKLVENNQRSYLGRQSIIALLSELPETEHDLHSFTIDVLAHDNKHMILVVGGIYKENNPENFVYFTRTFVFNSYKIQSTSAYHITNEMFSVSLASRQQIENNFKHPPKQHNGLQLTNPSDTESETICNMFMHLTMLKKSEAERWLHRHNWDLRLALMDFVNDMKVGKVPKRHMKEIEYDLLDVPPTELD